MSNLKQQNCFVVGIGASAEGLRALGEFFENMRPDSGAAFVVMPSDCKSWMPELLESRTQMVVKQVENGMEIEPNMVYLITPGNNLVIEKGKFRLIKHSESPSQQANYPIDIFFNSLAREKHQKAIAVLLYNKNRDGIRGLQSIKEEGGLTFAQSLQSAEFNDLPESVIEAGIADQLLSPGEIANSIYEIVQVKVDKTKSALAELQPQQIISIIEILKENENLDFSYYKLNTLSRRIYRRCSLSGYSQVDDYIAHLTLVKQERQSLKDDLMIGVTRFFRDPEAWEYLAENTLPALINSLEDGEELRAWVAACATGEEAYSLAILIDETINKLAKNLSVKIFATDIDTNALSKAAKGTYPESIVTDISHQRLEKYFIYRNHKYQVVGSLRAMIIFAPHNLIKNTGFTRMHLINCRNVLIYMQSNCQQNVLRILHFSLITQGILFLGGADNLGDVEQEFNPVNEAYKIYQKVRNIRLPLPNQNFEYLSSMYQDGRGQRKMDQFEPRINIAFSAFARRTQSSCLLVNKDFELFHIVTDGAEIIQVAEGAMTRIITEMVPLELKLPVNAAIQRAKREGKPVSYKEIHFNQKNARRTVNLEVIYFPASSRIDEFLMLIIENENNPTSSTRGETFAPDVESSQRIFDLEYELEQTKENLQATIEELETANEEHQATNEELLASNEELQSTNEELRLVNEELYTLNNEYKLKIGELIELNNDLDNLLRTTEIGVIFLDNHLKVRRFTPAVTVAINLVESDLERPIQHITHNLDGINLVELLENVLETQKCQEREVYLKQVNTYLLMRVYPYLDAHQIASGIVVILININEVKQVEKILQQKNEELECLYTTTPVGLALLNQEYRYVRINDLMAEINGFSVQEHLGKTLREILGEVAEKVEPIIDEVIKTQQPIANIEVEGVLLSNNNIKHTWLASYYPVKNIDDNVLVCAVVVEITELKQVQSLLVEKQQQLESLMLASKTFLYRCQPYPPYQATFMSNNLENILGFTAEQILAEPDFWVNHMYPEDLEQVMHQISNLSSWENKAFEYRVRSAEGSYRWFLDQVNLLRDEEGSPQEFVGCLIDITQRKIAELALEKQLQRERLVQKITNKIRQSIKPEDIFTTAVNAIGEALGVNRCLLHTYQPQEKNPVPIVAEYLHGDHCQSIKNQVIPLKNNPHIQELLRQEKAIAVDDVMVEPLLAPVAYLCAEFGIKSMLAIRTSYNSEPNGLLAVQYSPDVNVPESEKIRHWQPEEIELLEAVAAQLGIAIAHANFLKQAQQRQVELAEQNKILEETTIKANDANRTKSEFLANMSHELRTPLNAILGLAEGLQEQIFGELNETQLKSLATIERSGHHLLALINDILDLSKIESGKEELNLEAVNVLGLFEQSLSLIRQSAHNKNQGIVKEINAAITEIFADERRLRQVLVNLLNNAIKFTPEGGEITLKIELKPPGSNWQNEVGEMVTFEQATVCISVKDTGIGIARENLNKLFQPFTQIDSNLNRQYQGTGLGLALSQRIIKLHGGWITVSSEVNKGSEFTIVLPQALIQPKSTTDNNAANDNVNPTDINSRSSSPTILLAEDNEGNQQIIIDYLENSGYIILLAKNGVEAIEMAEKNKPDLILMDIQMPIINGLEAMRRIREIPSLVETPIIALTALAMKSDEQKCLAAGANFYLSKPFKLKELILSIQTLLNIAKVNAKTQE